MIPNLFFHFGSIEGGGYRRGPWSNSGRSNGDLWPPKPNCSGLEFKHKPRYLQRWGCADLRPWIPGNPSRYLEGTSPPRPRRPWPWKYWPGYRSVNVHPDVFSIRAGTLRRKDRRMLTTHNQRGCWLLKHCCANIPLLHWSDEAVKLLSRRLILVAHINVGSALSWLWLWRRQSKEFLRRFKIKACVARHEGPTPADPLRKWHLFSIKVDSAAWGCKRATSESQEP